MHVGDVDFDMEDPAWDMDATWGEVCSACCVHTPQEWAMGGLSCLAALTFLYFFLFGLELLGSGAKVMTGCTAGSLFGNETNPIAGLMIGILATVLLQSSSTTTSIIVSLVGAEAVTVKQGIYMVMGANIGTSVTNTIVALGHLGDGDQLERAFAGAVVHDMFNFLSVAILLPLEVISGYLYHLTSAMVKNIEPKDGDKWVGPLKKIVSPLAKKLIDANKDVIKDVAKGGSCDDYYPINCTDPENPTKDTCEVGLIACIKKTNECPAFFDPYADLGDDQMSGLVCFIIGLMVLFVCLFGLVKILNHMLMGTSTRIIYKATNMNGYLAMLIGAGITILVQSSSITTSALTPLVGMGVLRLEQMFPLTLGANIGTTVTAILAALLSTTEALQVALAHLFFNITGIIIWYPIPVMRNVPLYCARQLGKATRIWKGFPLVYIFVMFFIVPLIFLGLSSLYTGSKGLTVLGAFLTVVLFLFLVWLAYWCVFKNGSQYCYDCMATRQTRKEAMDALPDDMVYLKAKIKALSEHTGLPDEEEDVEEASDEKVDEAETEKPASDEAVDAEEEAAA